MIWCCSGDCCSRVVVTPQAPGPPRSTLLPKSGLGPASCWEERLDLKQRGRQSTLKSEACVLLVFVFYRRQSVNSCMLHLLIFAVVSSI